MMKAAFIVTALAAAVPATAADNGGPAAAETRECLQTRAIQQTEAGIDRNWYARLRDGSWWRNTMDCPVLRPRRALVHSSPIGSQCRGDIVQVIDFTQGGINYGGCGFGSWQRVAGPPAKNAKKQG